MYSLLVIGETLRFFFIFNLFSLKDCYWQEFEGKSDMILVFFSFQIIPWSSAKLCKYNAHFHYTSGDVL